MMSVSKQQRVQHDLSVSHNVATVTLQRPERYNSFNTQMLISLLHTLRSLEKDRSVKVIILTGSGKAFCTGQGLDDEAALQDDGGRALISLIERGYSRLVASIMMSRKVYVAAVNGVTAGAGFGIVCACDFRIVSDTATFTTAFAKIGLVPDSALSFTLPRIVGHAKAVELCMLSERIDAREAQAIGLCTKVVPPAHLIDESETLARSIATGASSLPLIKRELMLNSMPRIYEALDVELSLQKDAAKSHDFREGISAFRAKRPAVFTGR